MWSFLEKYTAYFRKYKKPIPTQEVFIGTILFYVIFTMVFFLTNHGNLEWSANIINLHNTLIVCFAIFLYVLTENIFCIVIALSSFLASSLADIVLGTLYYYDRMYLSTYAHHILYSFIMIESLISGKELLSLAMMSGYIEISAFFQGIKRMWDIKEKWFDIFNAALFFITRIVLFVPFLLIVYLCGDTFSEKLFSLIIFSTTALHIVWSKTQIKNIMRRYFSGNQSNNNNNSVANTDEYLTFT